MPPMDWERPAEPDDTIPVLSCRAFRPQGADDDRPYWLPGRDTPHGNLTGAPEQGTREDSLYRAPREASTAGKQSRVALLSLSRPIPPLPRIAGGALLSVFRSYGPDHDEPRGSRGAQDQQAPTPIPPPTARSDAAPRLQGGAGRTGRRSGGRSPAPRPRAVPLAIREDIEVRPRALNALADHPPERAHAKKVLARRDECSVPLRRGAGTSRRNRDEESATISSRWRDRSDPACGAMPCPPGAMPATRRSAPRKDLAIAPTTGPPGGALALRSRGGRRPNGCSGPSSSATTSRKRCVWRQSPSWRGAPMTVAWR